MGRDWYTFDPIGPGWNNYDVPFGLDWDVQQGATTHLIDGIADPDRVLTINLGTTANGASEIDFSVARNVKITPIKEDDFVDPLGNDVDQPNNINIPIANMTIPWVEEAKTFDTDSDGKINGVMLTWNTEVSQTPNPANPNVPMVDNTTLDPPKEILQIVTPADPYIDTYIVTKEIEGWGVYDTDYSDELSLYLDANNFFQDTFGNVRDFTQSGCNVSDGVPAVIVKACLWYTSIGGTYEVEVYFSEAIKDPDPNSTPDDYFVIDLGTNYRWLNMDGSDGVLNFLVDNLSSIISVVGNIEDLAGNVTPTGTFNLQGPRTKPDYWAYPDVAPFDTSGPIISDATMDLQGYVFDPNGDPLNACDWEVCDPTCEDCGPRSIVMAFRHKDLFDPNTCELVIDPARCIGATMLRGCDGYYAMHIYGNTCGDCDEGEAIILVVVKDYVDAGSVNRPLPYNATDPAYQNDLYIMTGLVQDDTGFYLEWVDSRLGAQPLFNMYLAKQEKIYLRPGWNLASTTLDKVYYDVDGAPPTGGVITSGTPLMNSNGAPTRDVVPMDDIEKVYFSISSPCGGWTKCCTFDAIHYLNGGFVVDYPSTSPMDLAENQIAFFSAGNGYFIHMANPGVLVVLGDSVLSRDDQPYTKAVNVGWNLAGYWSDWLRMVPTGPPIVNFAVGDFSSALEFPLVPGVNVDNLFFTPDEIFIGAGANHLRTYVNINNGTFTDIGVKVWDAGYMTYDFKYIGPGMAAWLNATTSPLQFD
jgi:hypothetical protein